MPRLDKLAPFIELGNLRLASYGLCIALGVLFSFTCGYLRLKRLGYDADGFLVVSGYGMIGGILGAKILFLFLFSEHFHLSLLLAPDYPFSLTSPSGFVVWGGLLLGALFVFAGAKLHCINLLPFLQNTLFVLPLSQGFGRIGCFFAGCCYGIPYDGPFAVIPEDTFFDQVARFPVQLLNASCLFVIALVLYRLPKKINALCFYVWLYAILRFMTEFLRGDVARGVWGYFSLSQYICMVVLTVMCIWYWYSKRHTVCKNGRDHHML